MFVTGENHTMKEHGLRPSEWGDDSIISTMDFMGHTSSPCAMFSDMHTVILLYASDLDDLF